MQAMRPIKTSKLIGLTYQTVIVRPTVGYVNLPINCVWLFDCVSQAPPRSAKAAGRKRGKAMLATSTPEMKRIRTDAAEKASKKCRPKMAKKKLFESPRQTDTQHPETVVGLPEKKRSGEGLKKNSVDEPAVKPKEDSRKKFRSSPKSNQPKRTKHQLKQPATMKQTNVRPNSKPRPNASRPPLPRRPTWLLVSGKSG